jgi:glutamate racemase
MLPSSRKPIGIFDSGVGGLTVVRAVRSLLPDEDIVYLGDTARVPYGSKSRETVLRYSQACARFLQARDIKILLVACNTATAHALPDLAASVDVPVVGAVEPGAMTAHQASKTGHIGVIGTLGTIRSGAYEAALRALDPSVNVTGQPCGLLVPLAEEGWTADGIARTVAERYLRELATRDPAIDTLVLGCTHYPLLVESIAHAAGRVFAHGVTLVDSATAMARVTREQLVARGDLCPEGRPAGELRCYVTDASRLDELAARFLGEPLGSFQTTDL